MRGFHLGITLLASFAFSSICAAQMAAPKSGVSPQGCAAGASQMTVSALESRGDDLRQQKAYSEALVCYDAALRKDSKNPVLLNKAGMAELLLTDSAAARKYFQKAIKNNRKYAEAYNNLGVAFYMDGNYKKAIKQYQKALSLEETASYHSNLGTVYFAQKKTNDAMWEYSRAIELDPDVLVRSSTGGIAAQVMSPADRAYYSYLIAKMYAKRGDVDRCLHCLQQAKEGGYSKIQEAYKDPDFAKVREDPRFSEYVAPEPQ